MRVSQGRIRLAASPVLFQELARHSGTNWPQYRRIVRYLRPLVRNRILLDGPLLMRNEFRARTSLNPSGRFAEKNHITRSWRTFSDRALLAAIVPRAREDADACALQHEELRKTLAPALEAIRPTVTLHVALMSWWAKDGFSTVYDMALESLDEMGRDLAGVRFPASFPVSQLPAFWHGLSYRFGRVIVDLAEGRKIRPSDYADPVHYAAAAYADVFLTDDTPMHHVHQLIPWSTVRPIRLADFFRRFLVE